MVSCRSPGSRWSGLRPNPVWNAQSIRRWALRGAIVPLLASKDLRRDGQVLRTDGRSIVLAPVFVTPPGGMSRLDRRDPGWPRRGGWPRPGPTTLCPSSSSRAAKMSQCWPRRPRSVARSARQSPRPSVRTMLRCRLGRSSTRENGRPPPASPSCSAGERPRSATTSRSRWSKGNSLAHNRGRRDSAVCRPLVQAGCPLAEIHSRRCSIS